MTTTIEVGKPGWWEAHLDLYLRTDGAEGHFLDFTPAGGPQQTPCLILKTKGRRSGEAKLTPLIYGMDGERFVLVGSKAGAPTHPAWFLNLQDAPEVGVQVAHKKYRGVARVAEGAERDRLFAMMAGIYPPYVDYQAKTDRRIPVVVIEPQVQVDQL